MKSLLRYLFLALLLHGADVAFAQKDVLYIYGQLKDKDTKKRLDGVMVIVYKDGNQFDTYNSGTSGKYEFSLPLGFVYDIKFTKQDFLTKIIRIDTRNIPEEDKAGGFETNIAGELFKAPEGFNTDLLKEPIAKAAFDNQTNSIAFDFEYTEKKQKMIDAEFKRLADIAKNFEKLKKQFDELVAAGDKKMIEEKYQEALVKYNEALAIFPKDEGAIAKRDAAQARVDAENAGKELEAKYKKLVETGDANFKAEKWADARKNYQEAIKLNPKPTYPKEQLYQIDLAEADSKKRGEYKAIIADADNKFKNEDYAVSIEKYKAASAMYPSEAYPKDQINKAQRALDNLLASEAEKQRIEKEYQDKINLADRNYKEDKLEMAIRNYQEASKIKPNESLPPKKIEEIQAILAERKAKEDAAKSAAMADAEKARIEKEYNDLIAIADGHFSKEQWLNAKEKYEAALLVKPDAQYPKTRIERIDLMLQQANDNLAAARQKAIADSLRAAKLASMDEGTKKRIALQQQAKDDFDARMKILEAQRMEAAQKVIDNKIRNRNLTSNASKQAEDEVEQFYRDAREKEEASRYNEIKQTQDENLSFYERRGKSSNSQITERQQQIEAKRTATAEIESNGASANLRAVSNGDRKKQQEAQNQKEYIERAKNREVARMSDVEKKRTALESVSSNDRYRVNKVQDLDDTKNRIAKNQNSYTKKGDASIKNNQLDIKDQEERVRNMNKEGEEVRKENEREVLEKQKLVTQKNNDNRKAADEKVMSTQLKMNNKKTESQQIGLDKEESLNKRADKIDNQKQDLELERLQKEIKNNQERFDRRNEILAKQKGEQKSEDQYLPVSGTESLPEGVSENSYKLGNKVVTERTVKIGNKVDTYRKVVSKTGIYYFKNDHSITEVIWDMETLGLPK